MASRNSNSRWLLPVIVDSLVSSARRVMGGPGTVWEWESSLYTNRPLGDYTRLLLFDIGHLCPHWFTSVYEVCRKFCFLLIPKHQRSDHFIFPPACIRASAMSRRGIFSSLMASWHVSCLSPSAPRLDHFVSVRGE